MRILVLAHGLQYGGAQVSTLEFVKLLEGRVSSIIVAVCEEANPQFVSDLRGIGLKVVAVPCTSVANYAKMDVSVASDIIEQADLVWISDEAYLAAPLIKKITNVPVIAHLRSYAMICSYWGASCGLKETCLEPCTPLHLVKCKQLHNQTLAEIGILSQKKANLYRVLDLGKGLLDFYRWPLRDETVINSTDGVVSVSQAALEIHERHLPQLRNKRKKVIYNPAGVPEAMLRKFANKEEADAPTKISFVDASGGLPTKGPHVYLQTLKLLVEKGLDFKATMVGCKGTWVERYADKIGVSEKVEIHGRLPRNQVYEIMGSSSVVVVPSIWPEPLGRSALEANQLGIPVVASRIGGLGEVVIDNKTGFLADPGNANDFATKVDKTLTSSFSREEIQQVTSKRFDPNRLVSELVTFFNEF